LLVKQKYSWPITYPLSVLAWLLLAESFTRVSLPLSAALALTIFCLLFTPYLLPKFKVMAEGQSAALRPAPRMVLGAVMVLITTNLASHIGPEWSGALSMFPVIGSVLAIFIHRSKGLTK